MYNVHADYAYREAGPTWSNGYLWGPLRSIVRRELPEGGRIFEVGCGNGATADMLTCLGYSITGIDPSESGIQIAKKTVPQANFSVASVYDELPKQYGQFPLVVSLEVVEHCFWPRKFASTIYELLTPGGLAVISTPYHGYLKNLLLALTNKFDTHWSPLWDGGHIKFWSQETLARLLRETGFESIEFVRVGRIAPIAKSMIALARKPREVASNELRMRGAP